MKKLRKIRFAVLLSLGVLLMGVTAYSLLMPIYVTTGHEDAYLTPRQVEDYTRLAEEGDAQAAFKLFDFYTYWRFESEPSRFWLQKLADMGNVKAKLLLFKFKHKNLIVAICGNESMHLAPPQIEENIQLAENGDSEAAFKLYLYYEIWKGDEKSAMEWLKKSADLGNETAIDNLGVMTGQNPDGDRMRTLYPDGTFR